MGYSWKRRGSGKWRGNGNYEREGEEKQERRDLKGELEVVKEVRGRKER